MKTFHDDSPKTLIQNFLNSAESAETKKDAENMLRSGIKRNTKKGYQEDTKKDVKKNTHRNLLISTPSSGEWPLESF